MRRLVPISLVLLAGLACEEKNEAIEITGYLDPDAIGFTAVESINEAYAVRASVFGPPGSVGPGSLVVENLSTGEAVSTRATTERSFAVELDVTAGDRLRVTQRYRVLEWDAHGQSPFPDAEVERVDGESDALVLVRSWEDFDWWVTNLDTGEVAPLDHIGEGRLHAVYTRDGWLQLHAEAPDGLETRAVLLAPRE